MFLVKGWNLGITIQVTWLIWELHTIWRTATRNLMGALSSWMMIPAFDFVAWSNKESAFIWSCSGCLSTFGVPIHAYDVDCIPSVSSAGKPCRWATMLEPHPIIGVSWFFDDGFDTRGPCRQLCLRPSSFEQSPQSQREKIGKYLRHQLLIAHCSLLHKAPATYSLLFIGKMDEGVGNAIPPTEIGRPLPHTFRHAKPPPLVWTPVPHIESGPYPRPFQPSSEIINMFIA